jgi:hypothetical protein
MFKTPMREEFNPTLLSCLPRRPVFSTSNQLDAMHA